MLLSWFGTSLLSMSSSNGYFFTCMQISQEAGQVVWYSHLLKNFPQLVVIYTVRGFGVVNKAELDVFLELSFFFSDPTDVGSLISGSFAFYQSSLDIWKFSVHRSLAWRILKITLLAGKMNTIMLYFKHSLALPFFGIWMKADLFQSCGHCWVFQIFWHIDCSTLTASTFRILNWSAGTLSPPLVLLIVMLPKAHLTSLSRMSGSRWMTTPSWLFRSLRPFLYTSVYSCHFFLMSSASVRSLPFLSFCVHP